MSESAGATAAAAPPSGAGPPAAPASGGASAPAAAMPLAQPGVVAVVLLVALFATRWTSYLSFHALPLIVGALADGYALTAAQAAYLATIELGALALAGLVAAAVIPGRSLRAAAALGAAIVAAAHFATAGADGFGPLLACRLAAGVGAGLLGASANAALAALPDPDKWFARIALLGGIAAAVLLGALPVLGAAFGPRSLFVALAAIMILVTLAARGLPAGRAAATSPAGPGGRLWTPQVAVAVLAIAVFSIGQGMIWAFAERVAVSIGIAPAELGTWFFGASLVGLAGPALAAWLGVRYGRTLPIVIGIVVLAFACLAFNLATNEWSFGVSLLVYWAAAQFAFPFVFGLSAALDPLGRLVTVATTTLMLMSAAAATVGAWLLPFGGYATLGWFTFASCLVAALLLAPVARARDRAAAAA